VITNLVVGRNRRGTARCCLDRVTHDAQWWPADDGLGAASDRCSVVGSFHELAADECGAGTHERGAFTASLWPARRRRAGL